ncbi:hypothetical protein CVT25_009363 [Psilocybe cyanescens]|uniref:PQ-loop repeat-containing protein 1 n=1 Tax=Psilocybe cyanescens TaxID=93625 RepID=A0A409XUX6_PSICY|nr:hypothetical protein CVT25_009363 [Psilocybe cyanescens]
MVVTWLSTLASIGMAVGPPLVYADQAFSIVKKKDSTGFSRDADSQYNEMLLLARLALLYICILYRPHISPETLGSSTRPLSFWQWPTYTQYIEFLAGLILCQAILFLIFGQSTTFVSILGFVALGLESTLPIPQLISNYRQRSLYGFRMSTLIGWVGGDSFKTVYFFLQHTPLQFQVCAIFQLSIDLAIIGQRITYGNAPPISAILTEEDELEQALVLGQE